MQKLAGRGDVLKRMATHHAVGRQVRILFRVVVLDKAEPGRKRLIRVAVGLVAGVDADAAVVAQLAHQHEELALSAADLEDLLVAKVIAVDPSLRQPLRERVERRREALRLLAVGGVLVYGGIEDAVVNKPARRAEAELKLPADS